MTSYLHCIEQVHLLFTGHFIVHQQHIVVISGVSLALPHSPIQEVRGLSGCLECVSEGGGELQPHLTGDGIKHALLPCRCTFKLQMVVLQKPLKLCRNFLCKIYNSL